MLGARYHSTALCGGTKGTYTRLSRWFVMASVVLNKAVNVMANLCMIYAVTYIV